MPKKCKHILIVPRITFTSDKFGRVKECPDCKKYYLDKCKCPPGYHSLFQECRPY